MELCCKMSFSKKEWLGVSTVQEEGLPCSKWEGMAVEVAIVLQLSFREVGGVWMHVYLADALPDLTARKYKKDEEFKNKFKVPMRSATCCYWNGRCCRVFTVGWDWLHWMRLTSTQRLVERGKFPTRSGDLSKGSELKYSGWYFKATGPLTFLQQLFT